MKCVFVYVSGLSHLVQPRSAKKCVDSKKNKKKSISDAVNDPKRGKILHTKLFFFSDSMG